LWLQQASQGKISKELVNHLMSILGHLIQLRTLKVPIFQGENSVKYIFLIFFVLHQAELFLAAGALVLTMIIK